MNFKNFINKNISQVKRGGLAVILKKIITLVKILFLVPIYLFSIPALIVIRLISSWYLIRFGSLESGRIGHFSANTELYFCEIESGINKPKQSYIDLFYYSEISNGQLAKMWKRKLNIMPYWLLFPINNLNKFLVNYFPSFKKHNIGNNTFRDKDINSLMDKCKIHLEFTTEEEMLGKKYLKKFGLSEKDKFVCLAVRDPAYLKTYHSYQDWDYHNYRDSNIDNYILAAEELASRGYYVFRMGKVVSSPIKSNNSKIIDYASSNLRNDFMDIYLGAKCTFCISASSGFDGVTTTFRRPLVQIVVPLLDAKTEHKEVLILTKHHFSKKKKRNLTFSEIVLSEIANCTATKQFEELGVELIENSPKEIRDIVIEAVERIEGKWKSTEIDGSLQNKFWKIFYSSNYINSKRFAHGKFKARFGAKFLRANPDWLN